MKKAKAVLSLAMAATIALSTAAPVFAADNGRALPMQFKTAVAVNKLEKAIKEATGGEDVVNLTNRIAEYIRTDKEAPYYGVNITMKPTKPTDEAYMAKYNAKIVEYDEIVKAYKNFTEAQKNAMDVKITGALLFEVMNREAYLINAADSTVQVNDAKTQVSKDMEKYLGKHETRDKAYALGAHLYTPYEEPNKKLMSSTKFENNPKAVAALDEYIKAYKESDELTRAYLDCVNGGFPQFMKPSRLGGKFKDLVTMMGNRWNAEDEPDVAVPKKGTKPNVKNYPGGATDPDYLADLEAYLPTAKAYHEATAANNNHQSDLYVKALKEVKSFAPEYATVVDVMIQMRDAYIAFDSKGDTSKADAALAAYNAMDAQSAEYFKSMASLKAYYAYFLNSKGDDYSYSNMIYSQLEGKLKEAQQMAVVKDFETWISLVNMDKVTNATVAEAQERYKAIPTSLQSKVSPEAKAKYDAIVAMYDPKAPATPSDDKFEEVFNDFRPTVVPELYLPLAKPALNLNIKTNDALLASLMRTALAKNANGTIKGAKDYSVFENRSMATLLSLYTAIGEANLEVSGIDVGKILASELTPSKLAKLLPEEQFAGARAKLEALAATDDTTAAYADITFDNGDWGFQNGDKEGFKAAVAAMLRPVANILDNGIMGGFIKIITLQNTKAANGDHIYGAYEYLIPMLESLGLKGIISSEDYTQNLFEAKKVSKEAGLSAVLSPVVGPIVDLVDELMKNPLNTLLDLMPRLARAINYDVLTKSVKNALSTSSLLGGMAGSIDLSGKAVNAMIAGKTFTFDMGKYATATITLKEVNWAKLAGCGKLELADSVSAFNMYRVDIKADRADTYSVVSKYIIRMIFTADINGKTQTVDLANLT